MRIYRPRYRDRQTGERRQAQRWYIGIMLGGREKKVRGYLDKRATQELGSKLVTLAGLRESGLEPDATLSKWVRGLPDAMKSRLAELDLIDARNVTITRSLKEHLEAYKAALLNGSASPRQKGPDTPEHVHLIEKRITAVLDGISAQHILKVDPEKVAEYLAGRRAKSRKDGGLSAASSNHYLSALRRFFTWMVRTDRASRNPLSMLALIDTAAHKKHVRRTFEPDELKLLLQYVRNAPICFGVDGESRYWLYRVASESGLRSGELRSLTVQSFDLCESSPSVTVAASYSKRRRADVMPLRTDTADGLRVFLASKLPAAPAFKMPSPCNIVRMLRADMSSARTEWIEAAGTHKEREARERSSMLKPVDDAGRVLDFHGLRVFFVSALIAGGADLKTAQDLARHSTPTLTMNTYAKRFRGTDRAAIANLPNLNATVRETDCAEAHTSTRATGTTGRMRR